jgi:hypothetical protein
MAHTCWIPRTTATAAVQSTPGATSISSSEPAPNAAFMISVFVDFSAGTKLQPCRVLAASVTFPVKGSHYQTEAVGSPGPQAGERGASRMKMHVCSCCSAGQKRSVRCRQVRHCSAKHLRSLDILQGQLTAGMPSCHYQHACKRAFPPSASTNSNPKRLNPAHLVDDVHGAPHQVAQHSVQRLLTLALVDLREQGLAHQLAPRCGSRYGGCNISNGLQTESGGMSQASSPHTSHEWKPEASHHSIQGSTARRSSRGAQPTSRLWRMLIVLMRDCTETTRGSCTA